MANSFRSPAKVLRRLTLAPLAARKLRNWPRFMYSYALGLVPSAPYVFRNGAQLQIGRGLDHAPIVEVFLREEYGAIPDGAAILDVGANIGAFSIYAARTARNVRICAYEPMPDFYSQLVRNVAINGLDGTVRCFNSAVAGDARSRRLFLYTEKFWFPTLVAPQDATSGTGVDVPCATLPDVLDSSGFAQVDLLKLDCEGAEYEILYNTADACFARIREIRMEYHNLPGEGRNVTALMAFLRERQYDIAQVDADAASRSNGNLWARKHA